MFYNFGRILNKLHLKKFGTKFISPLIFDLKKGTKYNNCIERLSLESEDGGGNILALNEFTKLTSYDIQIILPVYNVASYVKEAIDSILNQKGNLKYLLTIIDDGSTDGSSTIVDEYANYQNVEIIHQDNKGLSGARNTALKEIKAKYVTFVDSDDMLTSDALQIMYRKAIELDASIVQGSYETINMKGKRLESINFPDKDKNGQMAGYPWGKLFKSELFINFKFPEKYWFEDTILHLAIFPLTNDLKKVSISSPVYKYRINPNGISLTASKNPKIIDTLWITRKILENRKEMGFPPTDKEYDRFLRQVRINMLRINSYKQGKLNTYALNFQMQLKKRYFPLAKCSNPSFSYIDIALRVGNVNRLMFNIGLSV